MITAPAELKVRVPKCIVSPPTVPSEMLAPAKLALFVTVRLAVASLAISAVELNETLEAVLMPDNVVEESSWIVTAPAEL